MLLLVLNDWNIALINIVSHRPQECRFAPCIQYHPLLPIIHITSITYYNCVVANVRRELQCKPTFFGLCIAIVTVKVVFVKYSVYMYTYSYTPVNTDMVEIVIFA